MQVVDYIAKFIERKKIKHVFGYQGGGILPLIHSINKNKNIKYIQTYHEQAAGFAADAYARTTKNLGVALATNGPGATNLITAIANAYFDFSPCIFFTGQVNTFDINKIKGVRQNGFQEVDTISLVKNITKYAVRIENKNDIEKELKKAFEIAQTAPKGPVLIDLPLNIQKASVDIDIKEDNVSIKNNNIIEKNQIDKLMKCISESKRPVVIAGGGIKLANAQIEFEKFIEILNIPKVSTLSGLDIYSKNDFGFCGLYGRTEANIAINKSDLLIVIGSRLSKRQIGIKEKYAPNAKIVQIDINNNELGRVLNSYLNINSDIKLFLQSFLQEVDKYNITSHNDWLYELNNIKSKYKQSVEYNKKEIKPVEFINHISSYIQDNANIIFDVGQNQMWCAQGLYPQKKQNIINSAGLGCMGFSLPASIGAYYANFNQTIAFMGDGGLQMNLQELQLIFQNKIPIKIVIYNNKSLGMIQEVQMKFVNKEYIGTKLGYSVVNIKRLAYCYDILYKKIENKTDIDDLAQIFSDKSAYIIEVIMKESPTRLQTQYDEVKEYE